MRFFGRISIVAVLSLCGCCHCRNGQYGGTWRYDGNSNRLALFENTGTRIGVINMAAQKNTRFCRPANEGKALDYAPVILPPSTSAPSEWEYNNAGWFRNDVKPPVVPEGKIVDSVTYRYDEDENAVVADYTFEDAPKPVRTFSKLYLEDALFNEGVMGTVDAFIDSQTITNKFGQTMSLRRKYDTALDFRDDHPLFNPIVLKIQELLGWSDEKVEEVLSYAEK